jgi:hypothetical protein
VTGRKRKDGNHILPKDNSKEDSVENEENGYILPDPNKTIINVTKEPRDSHKKNPQEGSHGRNHRETHIEGSRHG